MPQIGDWASFDELEATTGKYLDDVLARALTTPFYTQRFAGQVTVDDFDSIPLTTKEDLIEAYPFGLKAVPQAELTNYFESSSSGGHATPAYYTRSDWADLVDRYARKPIGFRPEDILLVRSPYALGLAAHVTAEVARHFGVTVVPGDMRSSVIPYPRVVRLLHDLGVTLTWSNPTDCFLWAATARRQGLDPARDFPSLRGLIVGGEPLSDARHDRLSEVWGGIPVVDEYGCTEVGSLAGVCPNGSFHFWADRLKAEVLDRETGRLSASGMGELVVTPLMLEAMPLLRYNTGDRVDLRYEDCACGWNLPKIRVLGRTAQGYEVAGRRLTQIDLDDIVYRLPMAMGVLFWRARAESDRLLVQVESGGTGGGDAPITKAVSDAVRETLEVPVDVEVLPPGGLVPDEMIVRPKQSLKPRSLYGPGENWDQAIVLVGS